MEKSKNIELYTFDTIFEGAFDVHDKEGVTKQVQLSKIVIPMIQRDYAYGRDGKDVTKKRDRFLEALHRALQDKTPLVLDFVYGDIDEEGVMTPLDGQQRLTTLFLLYWYAAQRDCVNKADYQFLYNFSYDTRPNARDFCKHLVDTVIKPNGGSTQLNVRHLIENESWFLLEYVKDATIKSMLTMLDAIDNKFCAVSSLWQRLTDDKIISFYFLPIQDMGLTDEIYIKMNSRGKPLTDFENFKAELTKDIEAVYGEGTQRSQALSVKIDTDWADLLWHYRDDTCHIIDDYFLRYFKFVCAVICYESGDDWSAMSHDEDDLLDKYFALDDAQTNPDDVRTNLEMLEKYFDIWTVFSHPAELFDTLFARKHTEGKVLITKISNELDLFEQCIKHFDENSFTLGKFVMLYAVIQYLINKDAITDEQCFVRMRIVRNLVQNSNDELREERMCAIVKQVQAVVITGELKSAARGLNAYQVQEERDKYKLLQDRPSVASMLYKLEEHSLLYGQIAVIGLENVGLCDRFYSLFECNRTKIDRALLTVGDDYWQDCGWKWLGGQYQAGAKYDSSWTTLFHKSSLERFDNTKSALIALLSKTSDFTDTFLDTLIQDYIKQCKESSLYDWRYYYLSYDAFCPQSYGLYRFNSCDGGWYEITALCTSRNLSNTSYAPFLQAIIDEMDEGELAGDFNQELLIRGAVVTCNNRGFIIRRGNKEEQLSIGQNNEHIDKEERVKKIVARLVKMTATDGTAS